MGARDLILAVVLVLFGLGVCAAVLMWAYYSGGDEF